MECLMQMRRVLTKDHFECVCKILCGLKNNHISEGQCDILISSIIIDKPNVYRVYEALIEPDRPLTFELRQEDHDPLPSREGAPCKANSSDGSSTCNDLEADFILRNDIEANIFKEFSIMHYSEE